MQDNQDTILIEIAAYCDPEIVNTVKSALIQADYPERIHFAICYQSDNLDDYNELKKIKNCRIKYFKESEARGSVYARYFCQQMIEDEKYIYQIDSHMRFVKHWDTKIIKQLQSLKDPKAILSVYPPYCTEEMMKKPLNDPLFDKPADGGLLYTNGFKDNESYFLQYNSIPIKKDDYRAYAKNAFIAAGNFFTYSQAHKDVIHDKEMYFYGDEFPMSIRLFTHGWNVYNPGESYIYHQYERKNQKFPPVTDAMKNENKRLMDLLNINGENIDLKECGLGNVRTLKDYEEFAGIDFKTKTVYMNAETGEFENKDMQKKISYLQQKQIEKHKKLAQSENIEVIIIDPFDDYQTCIKSCLAKSTNADNIQFLIASKTKTPPTVDYCNNNKIKVFMMIKETENYTQALSKLTAYLSDGFAAIIDSSTRFVTGWDTSQCQTLKMCGEQSALTNWVWKADDKVDVDNFYCYNNVIKELDRFYNYLPSLRYNDSIDLSKRTSPYHTPFISDGFIFLKAEILKNIPIDPTLTYEEHQYIYALRLWTHGINIYYPQVSYFIRTKEENKLHEGVKNLAIICGLTGINNYYSKSLLANYKYDLGEVRPLWLWYDLLNIKYDTNTMQLIEEKTN